MYLVSSAIRAAKVTVSCGGSPPASVSAARLRDATGVRSSWARLATKSARTASSRRTSVMSSRWRKTPSAPRWIPLIRRTLPKLATSTSQGPACPARTSRARSSIAGLRVIAITLPGSDGDSKNPSAEVEASTTRSDVSTRSHISPGVSRAAAFQPLLVISAVASGAVAGPIGCRPGSLTGASVSPLRFVNHPITRPAGVADKAGRQLVAALEALSHHPAGDAVTAFLGHQLEENRLVAAEHQLLRPLLHAGPARVGLQTAAAAATARAAAVLDHGVPDLSGGSLAAPEDPVQDPAASHPGAHGDPPKVPVRPT